MSHSTLRAQIRKHQRAAAKLAKHRDAAKIKARRFEGVAHEFETRHNHEIAQMKRAEEYLRSLGPVGRKKKRVRKHSPKRHKAGRRRSHR